jgi:hypothetical protein
MSTNRGQSTAAGAPRCPAGWNTSAQNSQECFPVCPANYTFKNPGTGVQASGQVDPNPSCVFNADPKYYVPVTNVNINSSQSEFNAAKTSFDGLIAAKNAEIGNTGIVAAAREALLSAENGRASNPGGYQQARVNYYTLTQGDSWINSEKNRILRAEIDPEVSNYRLLVDQLIKRLQVQDQYTDVVRRTSDTVVRAKDDFKYIVNSFSKQMDILNVEKEKQQREAADREQTNFEWIDGLLNWAIIILLLAVIAFIGYRVYKRYKAKGDTQDVEFTGTLTTK